MMYMLIHAIGHCVRIYCPLSAEIVRGIASSTP